MKEIAAHEITEILKSQIGNFAGFAANTRGGQDTEGYIHSTRFGWIELKDGRSGFNPTIHIANIASITLADGTYYTVRN